MGVGPLVRIDDDVARKLKSGEKLTPAERQHLQEVRLTNAALHAASRSTAGQDKTSSAVRIAVLVALALGIAAGVVALIVGVLRTEDAATIVTGGAVTIGFAVVGGLINPLQTVERDIVYRRWSDAIAVGFWLRIADSRAGSREIGKVAAEASSQFAALAGAYAANASKTLETLEVMIQSGHSERDEDVADNVLTIENPGDQSGTEGQALGKGVQVTVVCAGEVKFESTPLPPGLTLDSSGLITGTPTAAGPFEVTVRARVDEAGLAASVTFKWTIDGLSGDGATLDEDLKPR